MFERQGCCTVGDVSDALGPTVGVDKVVRHLRELSAIELVDLIGGEDYSDRRALRYEPAAGVMQTLAGMRRRGSLAPAEVTSGTLPTEDAVVRALDHPIRKAILRYAAAHDATRGRPSYRNFMGSGVDRGLRSVDTARSALGHVMFQIEHADGSANAGGAVEKSKLWLTRYGSLRDFSEWADETAGLLWFPRPNPQGQLLPGVDRGHRLDEWPLTRPLAAEMSPRLFGLGLELWDQNGNRLGPIEDLDLYVNDDPTKTLTDVHGPQNGALRIVGVFNERANQSQRCVWEATIDTNGSVRAKVELEVRRGYGHTRELSELLEEWQPTVYFLDGTTTIGPIRYDSRHGRAQFELERLATHPWGNVDLTAETRRTASRRGNGQPSIHEVSRAGFRGDRVCRFPLLVRG